LHEIQVTVLALAHMTLISCIYCRRKKQFCDHFMF
jgi:hypothetical protein